MRGCVQTLGRCEELGVLGATQHLQASRQWVCSELVVFVSLGLCWPVHLHLSGLLGLPQGPSAPSSQASGLLRPGAWGPLFVRVVFHVCGRADPASDGPGGRRFGHVCAVGSSSGVD